MPGWPGASHSIQGLRGRSSASRPTSTTRCGSSGRCTISSSRAPRRTRSAATGRLRRRPSPRTRTRSAARIRQDVVQTNEVQRCVALLPAFLTVARETGLPVELLELGPSAGLNLLVDRYRYAYAEGRLGAARTRCSSSSADERGRPVPAELLATRVSTCAAAAGSTWRPSTRRARRATCCSGASSGRGSRIASAASMLRSRPSGRARAAGADPGRLRGATAGAARRAPRGCASPSCFRRPRRATCPRTRPRGSGRRSTRPASDGRPLAWVSTRRHDEREGAVEDAYELELRVWPGAVRGLRRISTSMATGSNGFSHDHLTRQRDAEARPQAPRAAEAPRRERALRRRGGGPRRGGRAPRGSSPCTSSSPGRRSTSPCSPASRRCRIPLARSASTAAPTSRPASGTPASPSGASPTRGTSAP